MGSTEIWYATGEQRSVPQMHIPFSERKIALIM